jgi:hypothetical protein
LPEMVLLFVFLREVSIMLDKVFDFVKFPPCS